MAYVQTVMFAIQAGLRLYGAARKAYADSARGTALMLPLPRAVGVKPDSADTWFLLSKQGQEIVEANPRVKWLIEQRPRTAAQAAEYVDLYRYYWSQANPDGKAGEGDPDDVRGGLDVDEMSALLKVRQWSSTETAGMVTALQTIAGTLVNIAVDYFVQTPGVVSEDRPEGRALKAFLQALDETDFGAVPPTEIASGLMVAVLETVAEYPGLISGGENEQKLITNVSKSITASARKFLDENSTDKERQEVGVWLQLVGRAVFKGAAETVLAEPGRYLKAKPGAESEIASEIGGTITNLLLGGKEFDFGNGQFLKFKDLFSAAGLDQVAKSTLSAVAKNPGILKVDEKGVENIIVAVAEGLAEQKGRIAPEILPEVVRLVIDKSADNLELLWPKSHNSPQRHLLVIATSTFLKAIAKPAPPNSKWNPQFTPDQLLDLAEAVLDEVVDNPAWIIDEAGNESGTLQKAVEAILAALRKVPGQRLSAETGIAVLKVGISAVGLRLSFLDRLPGAAGEPERAAITAALDALFSEIFADGVGADANWDLARNSTLVVLTEIALEKLADSSLTVQPIEILRQEAQTLLQSGTPFDSDAFAEKLEKELRNAA